MRPKKLLALVLSLVMVVSMFTITATTVSAENTGKIKNVIYLIPDGGGMAPFWLADAVKQAGGISRSVAPNGTVQTTNRMYLQDYLVGAQTTHANNSAITDSAAAGTALAGGYKTNLYHIGVDTEMKPHANLLEAAQLAGKKTGLVSIYEFAHATPAAFSAHDSFRSDYRAMAEQIVNQGIDVVLSPEISSNGWAGAYTAITDLGYTIVDSKAEVNAIGNGDKVWGDFSVGNPFDYATTSSNPTLAEMTAAAIRALENENGFFLMVEGSAIDEGGHNQNAFQMVGDFIAFDEACKIAIEYAKGRTDTVVLVTPDHDTGGMNVLNQATAVSNIQNGSVPSTSVVSWDSTYHTARNGGVFLYVPEGISYPAGASSNPGVKSNFDNYVIDNTAIAPYLADLMGTNLDAATQELFVDVTGIGVYTPTMDSSSGSNTHTGMFRFNDADASIERNCSVATYQGQTVDLDGQVSVYENGKFYVPKKLLDILGLEAPEEGTGTSGPSTNLITSDSVINMGTARTLWGNVQERSGATQDGDYIRLEAGGYVTFNVPVQTSGIYCLQVKSAGGNTTLAAEVENRYYAELPVSSAEAYYHRNADGEYEFLYAPVGTVLVKLSNIGSEAITVSAVELMASQIAVDNGVTPTLADVKLVSGGNAAETEPTAPDEMTYETLVANASDLSGVSTTNTKNVLYFLPNTFGSVQVTVGVPKTGYYNINAILGSSTGGDKIYDNISVTTEANETLTYSRNTAGSGFSYVESPGTVYLVKGNRTLYFTANTSSGNGIYLRGVKLVEDSGVTPTPTPTLIPTATPEPTPTPELPDGLTWIGNSSQQEGFNQYEGAIDGPDMLRVGQSATINVDASYTGVFGVQLRIDGLGGASTLRVAAGNYYCDFTFNGSETGWTDSPCLDRPLYLTQGTNTLTLTNFGPSDIDVARLDLAKLNVDGYDSTVYLPLVGMLSGAEPTPTPTTEPTPTPTPTVTPEGITTESIDMPGSAASVWENVTNQSATGISGTTSRLAINAGAEAHFRITAPQTGFYYLQIKARNGDTTLRTEVDPVAGQPTYYAEMPVAVTTQFYNKNADGAYEFMYLTEGEHQLVLKNMGEVSCRVERLELKASTYAYEAGTTPTMADCKTYVPKDTKGFYTLDTTDTTATVSYTKYTNDNPKVMFVMASYDGNKLVGINLTEIDVSKQEAGTTTNYTVSLEGATGTVKTMLLTENLVPLF